MGHYAKRVDRDGKTYLYKAKDLNKDQTYFLSQISNEQLRSCLFPLGDITKEEVVQNGSALIDVLRFHFNGIDNLLDENTKNQDALALVKYISEDEKEDKILENQQILKTPVVRNGKQATVGYQPDVWKNWN